MRKTSQQLINEKPIELCCGLHPRLEASGGSAEVRLHDLQHFSLPDDVCDFFVGVYRFAASWKTTNAISKIIHYIILALHALGVVRERGLI